MEAECPYMKDHTITLDAYVLRVVFLQYRGDPLQCELMFARVNDCTVANDKREH